MAEYIEREALRKVLEVWRDAHADVDDEQGCGLLEDVIWEVAEQPAADVAPVVRCKDCKYNRGSKKCLNPDSFFAVPKDDDFCSYGERKDGGERNG